MTSRKKCPDCGSADMSDPDKDGWQMCGNCGSDSSPDYKPGDDDDDDAPPDLSTGLYQNIPLEPPDYTELARKVRELPLEERIAAALQYAKALYGNAWAQYTPPDDEQIARYLHEPD